MIMAVIYRKNYRKKKLYFLQPPFIASHELCLMSSYDSIGLSMKIIVNINTNTVPICLYIWA
jgi:hypothetical protein